MNLSVADLLLLISQRVIELNTQTPKSQFVWLEIAPHVGRVDVRVCPVDGFVDATAPMQKMTAHYQATANHTLAEAKTELFELFMFLGKQLELQEAA